MAIRVRSFSKINLGLYIGPVRSDGFHGLCTLYQTLALHDMVTVSAKASAQTHLTLTSNHEGVPTDHRNTAWRIVEAALDRMGVTAEVAIHIQKNLPVQGGMGAGSANAVAALIGLENELNQSLPPDQRMLLAGEIGSDVPLFLVGGASLGSSRGEIAEPYPDLPPTPCVIAAPSVGVSTPAAFREWDRQQAEKAAKAALTGIPQTDRLEELSRVYASIASAMGHTWAGASGVPGGGFGNAMLPSSTTGDLAGNPLPALVRTGISNDFQEVVFEQHPPLRDILQALMGDEVLPEEQRATVAMLSGSGSSLFGLYRTPEDAEAAARRVQAQGTRALVTTTLPRSQYWGTMLAGPEE